MNGYAGKLDRVDLGKWKTHVEETSEDISRMYLGGTGYAARIIYDQLAIGIDPLSPKNILMLAIGPLSLSRVPSRDSLMLCFKSHLTGVWGEHAWVAISVQM